MPKDDALRWSLVTGIAAIGIMTQLKVFATVGIKPIVLMIRETVFLALLRGVVEGSNKAPR